jgi:hypothetical protein
MTDDGVMDDGAYREDPPAGEDDHFVPRCQSISAACRAFMEQGATDELVTVAVATVLHRIISKQLSCTHTACVRGLMHDVSDGICQQYARRGTTTESECPSDAWPRLQRALRARTRGTGRLLGRRDRRHGR